MVVASSQMTNLSPFEFRVVFAKEQFFWGHVEYNDIFKIKRTARFCAVIVPSEHTVAGKYQLAGEGAGESVIGGKLCGGTIVALRNQRPEDCAVV